VLFAFSNISAKRFGTAKRDSYHLAVLNRLVVIFCHTTWWAVSLGARNDNSFFGVGGENGGFAAIFSHPS